MSTVAEKMEADAFAWLGEQEDVDIQHFRHCSQWDLHIGSNSFYGDCLADVVCGAHEELCLKKLRKQMWDSEE